MPVRVRKVHRKILGLLVLFGLQAGLAAGSMRAGAELDRSPKAETAAAVITPLAAPAAESTAPAQAAPEPAPAPSPAAALVPADRLYLEPILADAALQY